MGPDSWQLWELQYRLIQCRPYLVTRLIQHPRFRAAYDFLLLRAQINEIPAEIASWWTNFIDADEGEKAHLIEQLATQHKKPKRNRRRGKFI